MRRKPLVLGANIIEQLQPEDRLDLGRLNIGPPVQLNLISNSITVTGSFHSVYVNAPSSNDRQLRTINGGETGDILVLIGTDDGDDISLRDNLGNLRIAGNWTLSASVDTILLLKLGENWVELGRSNNG